jgi:beta-glucosidase
VPSAKTFPGTDRKPLLNNPIPGRPAEALYEEGIYVGYRYYSTFNVRAAYELNSKQFDGELTATVKVTNTGRVPGRDVVQLYVSAPARQLDKPAIELKGFAKTELLQPGQSQTLRFTVTAADLASFDPSTSAWVAEAGTYTIKVGASSTRIRQSSKIELKKEILVERVNKALAPRVKINELKLK